MSSDNKNKPRGQTVPYEEKGYSGELSTLGKITCLIEHFDNISLTDEDLRSIVPLENIREKESFKSGYRLGIVLINQGFTEENYHKFIENLRTKPKEKIEEIRKTRT